MIAISRPDDVAHRMRDRILILFKNHPEILKIQHEMLSSKILLEFPEIEFLDLNPTYAEMCWAFHSALQIAQQDLEKP